MRLLVVILMSVGFSQTGAAAQWIDRSPHQVRFVDVAPDTRLEVLDWGGSGPAMVFLAGLGLNAHAFDDFAPRFKDSYRVIGITRRGHGASSWPKSGYTLEVLVRDVIGVVERLKIERAIFAGHSFAGLELTQLASALPARVAGLVYLDAIQDARHMAAIGEHCPNGPEVLAAGERSLPNPDALRATQWRAGKDGARLPFASDAALAQILADAPVPAYTRVSAPALAVVYVPAWIGEVYAGLAMSQPCMAAFQRVIYDGIAAFTSGVQRATLVTLLDGNHWLHLVVPDEVEKAMRRWIAHAIERK